MADFRSIVKFESVGALTSGAGKDRFEAPFDCEILTVDAVVGTAPTGANLVLDILKNGTSIFTTTANRPTILAGATKVAVPTARPDVTDVAAGDVIELQIVQIGSTVAGSDLDVSVQYTAG